MRYLCSECYQKKELMEAFCYDAKKIYMLFFLCTCLKITASESKKEELILLAALESSQPITISRAYSSMIGDKQRHEITTPKETIVLKGNMGVSRQNAKVAMQSSPNGQYVFVESGQNIVRVFTLSPKDNTFVYTSTFPVLNIVDTTEIQQ